MNTARQLLPGVPWFDVPDPASPDLDELAHRFHLHELQIEDTRHRPQRAKVDEYGIYLFAVLKHLHAGDKPLFDDFDVFLGSDFLITVHQGDAPLLAKVCQRVQENHVERLDRILYLLMDLIVDEYLTQAQIVDYLLASDVYVTPYLDPQQITSGTLAYALGAGKAIVSTPYPHAVEVLTAERGILVPFRSQSALAEATLRILGDPKLKRRLEHEAYAYGRETAWPRVGERMLAILRSAAFWSDLPPGEVRVLAGTVGG